MIILAIDADAKALEQLENSLKAVFTNAVTITFSNALKSYRYYLEHVADVALIFFPLTIKPFDGFKYAALLDQASFHGSLVYTTQTDNDEIRELIRLNGGNRYIPKPVTIEKIRAFATLKQELCLDVYDEDYRGVCIDCVYHWCEKAMAGIATRHVGQLA